MKRRAVPVACALITLGFSSSAADAPAFRSARPIWPKGRATEMNLFVGFRAAITPPANAKVVLRVAASTLYRAHVNGRFVAHGPARGPHGHYRVDEWDITGALGAGGNTVSLEVAGYNVNSYYLLDQPSFLQAEVLAGDTVLASTAGEGTRFDAAMLDDRVQKVQRYSFQRPFVEVYRLSPGFDRWRQEASAPFAAVETEVLEARQLLPRRVPVPEFAIARPVSHVSGGRVLKLPTVERLWKDRALVNIGPTLKGYPEAELDTVLSTELQLLASVPEAPVSRPWTAGDTMVLSAGGYRILDLGRNLTGFWPSTRS
jgi:alpha-L-rhamnosidase